ncbi:MAG TPA: hypothetical protein VIJ14_11025, partial [Rhabdochlamydiaceae bacterium]
NENAKKKSVSRENKTMSKSKVFSSQASTSTHTPHHCPSTVPQSVRSKHVSFDTNPTRPQKTPYHRVFVEKRACFCCGKHRHIVKDCIYNGTPPQKTKVINRKPIENILLKSPKLVKKTKVTSPKTKFVVKVTKQIIDQPISKSSTFQPK